MSPTDFFFQHTMQVPAAPADVHAVLVDLEYFGSWWPQVRAVAKLGDDDALVICRSALPYDLELHLHAESRSAELLRVRIDGPISGYAQWQLTAVDGGTRLEFEQRVHAVAPLIRLASYVAKPVLGWNHRAMMRGAQEGLEKRFSSASRRG